MRDLLISVRYNGRLVPEVQPQRNPVVVAPRASTGDQEKENRGGAAPFSQHEGEG